MVDWNKNTYSRSNNWYLLQQLDTCICFQAYAQLFEKLDVQTTTSQPVEQIIARQIATSCENRTFPLMLIVVATPAPSHVKGSYSSNVTN